MMLYAVSLDEEDRGLIPLAWGLQNSIPETVSKAIECGADPNAYLLRDALCCDARAGQDGLSPAGE